MKVFLRFLALIAFVMIPFAIAVKCEQGKDPYAEGLHFDYSIECLNGFVYRTKANKGTIQVLNSDGTPLKCGHKIY